MQLGDLIPFRGDMAEVIHISDPWGTGEIEITVRPIGAKQANTYRFIAKEGQ